MNQTAPLILRLVASSVCAANQAGKIIRDIMTRGDLAIVEKGKNDLQTEADRSAQKCIISSLTKQFPNIHIIGEEGSNDGDVPPEWLVSDFDKKVLELDCPNELSKINDNDIVVWVDPLDGTSEYTQGLLDHVTVLIGIAVGDKAVGGVIHQPYFNYENGTNELGRTIWGIEGIGVGGFSPVEPPPNERIVATTRSHSDGIVNEAVEAMEPTKVIRVGGAGHKVMLLMEGKAHAYVFASKGSKRWDTCAPEAILRALGGELTDMAGNHYCYNKDTPHGNTGGVLGTAKGLDHKWYLNKVPRSVITALKL
ncbi:hypothetical protein RUM44_001346 [Polyplax serrata]|uniref:3'(2'),5'-bisphosphate nucleotidase 1 n=1 Tax=Polyplax serrata TaxID=468196 RepID=A0ABR1AJR7_POLSC